MENNIETKSFKNSKITITNQNITNLCGVSKVCSATENCISVIVDNKNFIFEGNNLQVTKLDVESGIVDFEGTIFSIKLGKQKAKKNIFKRIFD